MRASILLESKESRYSLPEKILISDFVVRDLDNDLIVFDFKKKEYKVDIEDGKIFVNCDFQDFDYKKFLDSNLHIERLSKIKVFDLADMQLTAMNLICTCNQLDTYFNIVRFVIYDINLDSSMSVYKFDEENIEKYNTCYTPVGG